MIFLLVYDKYKQRLLKDAEFSDSDSGKAESERQLLEAQFGGNDLVEVVLLRSNDRETLMQTHSRYFFSAAEIAANLKELAQ